MSRLIEVWICTTEVADYGVGYPSDKLVKMTLHSEARYEKAGSDPTKSKSITCYLYRAVVGVPNRHKPTLFFNTVYDGMKEYPFGIISHWKTVNREGKPHATLSSFPSVHFNYILYHTDYTLAVTLINDDV